MEIIDPNVVQSAEGLWAQISIFLRSLLLPWRLWQVGIVVGLLALAWAVNRLVSPLFERWLRSLEGRPKWQMRLLVVIRRRIPGLIFVALAWVAVMAIYQVTPFISRRYLVELVATIATAWALIGLGAAVIRNRFLRRVVTWAAWIYVTLHFMGFIAPTSEFLDSLAIDFGDFRLSVLSALKALAVTGLLFSGARLLSQQVAKRIGRSEDISPAMRVLSVKLLQTILFGTAFFMGLKAVGFDLTGLAVLSGAVGVGLGFGLQKVVSNLVSGVIILLDKSIKPGDVISLGETFGWIEALGARYVSVVTRDGKEYLIPNEELITGQVVNWSHSNNFVRLDLTFGAAYGDDPHRVRALAVAAAESVGRVLKDRQTVCHITAFGDSSIDYLLRFWIRDPIEGLANIRGDVYLALWDAFKAHGISIPFPQREVRLLRDPDPVAD